MKNLENHEANAAAPSAPARTATAARLQDACDEMAAVIRDMALPETAVRRLVSFEVAEFIYSQEPLRARHE